MKHKRVCVVLICVLCTFAVLFAAQYIVSKQHTLIDLWSQNLKPEQIEWAEIATGYGTEKLSYTVPETEYSELISYLETVTEENASRKERYGFLDYYLALRYEQKLWLLHCTDEHGMVGITFEDPETAELYGCGKNGGILTIESPALWDYILNTANIKGQK